MYINGNKLRVRGYQLVYICDFASDVVTKPLGDLVCLGILFFFIYHHRFFFGFLYLLSGQS